MTLYIYIIVLHNCLKISGEQKDRHTDTEEDAYIGVFFN